MQKYPPITQAELPPYPVHVGLHRYHTEQRVFDTEYQPLKPSQPATRNAAGREFEADE